jgi:hypothetical protein
MLPRSCHNASKTLTPWFFMFLCFNGLISDHTLFLNDIQNTETGRLFKIGQSALRKCDIHFIKCKSSLH